MVPVRFHGASEYLDCSHLAGIPDIAEQRLTSPAQAPGVQGPAASLLIFGVRTLSE